MPASGGHGGGDRQRGREPAGDAQRGGGGRDDQRDEQQAARARARRRPSPTPSRTSSAVSQRATVAPSEGDASRSKEVSASGRCATASAAPVASASPAAPHQVGGGDAEQVAEQQLLEPRRRLGREREHARRAPNSAETATATPTSAPIRSSRATSAIAAGGDERPAGGAEHQRRAGQRGDHEPGQQSVAHRLGGVGLAVQQDPHAERAEREREDQRPRTAPGG